MNILYAIQATGNGHISRAGQLLPHLNKYGKVDTFLSGGNSTLEPNFEVKYRSPGLSLYYGKCGKLSYLDCVRKNYFIKAFKMAKELPVEKYDVVINDFEYITSKACILKNIPSVHFGHQASFASENTPRPSNKSILGEYILKNYTKSSFNLGLHFDKYDDFIFPAVIKDEILQAEPKDLGYITIYLPSVKIDCILEQLKSLKYLSFQWFSHEISTIKKEGNITFFPIDNKLFTRSLIACHGLITGGGFETPSEALFLKKKLLCIPINNQYEQQCNGAALKKLGVSVIDDFDAKNFSKYVVDWIHLPDGHIQIKSNDIDSTLDYMFKNYPKS